MADYPIQFVRGLQEENPWWQNGKSRLDIPSFKRSDYFYFKQLTDSPKINILIGPRRVGKTTLIDQIIQFLLEEKKVSPNRIFFISLERPYFELVPNKLINAVEFFEQSILRELIGQSKEMIYLFIDEAQYDPIWARLLKQYCDQKKNIFAIVSGSSSTAVYKNTTESGAGRFHTHYMMAMKFRDVLRFQIPEKDTEIYEASKELRSAFVNSCKHGDPQIYLKTASKLLPKFLSLPIEGIFEDYLLKGGYPEFYTNKNWKEISKYYQTNVFDAVIQKDVVNVFDLKFPQRIRKLLVQILEKSSSILSRAKLAEALHMTGRLKTLDQYTEALSEAFLIRTAIKFSTVRGRLSTKEKKYFASDLGLRNAVLGIEEAPFKDQERGEVLETVMFNHTLRLAFHIDQQVRKYGYYWQNHDGFGERDIILDIRKTHKNVIPIEVKSGQCGMQDLKSVKITISNIAAPFGVVTCKDRLSIQDNVIIIPNWMFCLTS